MLNYEPEIYFTQIGAFGQTKSDDKKTNVGEKIELAFSIENADEGSYSIQAKLYEDQVLDFFTELRPCYVKESFHFDKFFVCDFIFEKQQDIDITLIKNDKEIKLKTTLGGIIGSKNSTIKYKYSGNEILVIRAKKLGKYEDLLNVQFILREKNSVNNDYFLQNKVYYVITSNNKKLYQSSLITKEGTFEYIDIPICLLKDGYSVKFFNTYKQQIYSFKGTIQQVRQEKKVYQIPNKDNKCLLLIDNSEITKNFTFIDYIKAGVKIALSIGIDFTGSNGHPLDKNTNHSIRDKKQNDYERAILSCGKIVGDYDYDQLFPVFGFGAIINSSPNAQNKDNKKETSMCFNLNFSNQPEIKTIDNILKIYRDCLLKNKITFSGPTEFTPLIKEVISRINKDDLFEYHILMILTDGVINDLQETIDILVEASLLPLSVIIIGIGNDKFEKMESLDGDTIPLTSSKGEKRKRDIVQFVPFSEFQNDGEKLAMEVLAEIPTQLVEYYRYKNLNPEKIKELTINNSGFSIENIEYYSNHNIVVMKNSIKQPSQNGQIINNSNLIQNGQNNKNGNIYNQNDKSVMNNNKIISNNDNANNKNIQINNIKNIQIKNIPQILENENNKEVNKQNNNKNPKPGENNNPSSISFKNANFNPEFNPLYTKRTAKLKNLDNNTVLKKKEESIPGACFTHRNPSKVPNPFFQNKNNNNNDKKNNNNVQSNNTNNKNLNNNMNNFNFNNINNINIINNGGNNITNLNMNINNNNINISINNQPAKEGFKNNNKIDLDSLPEYKTIQLEKK